MREADFLTAYVSACVCRRSVRTALVCVSHHCGLTSNALSEIRRRGIEGRAAKAEKSPYGRGEMRVNRVPPDISLFEVSLWGPLSSSSSSLCLCPFVFSLLPSFLLSAAVKKEQQPPREAGGGGGTVGALQGASLRPGFIAGVDALS
mmetsp:Transcript_55838/g.109308  ORF Transcript_55838/g.109308 Transcript_55838/m.109308 type:complete len:147 (-) Transcript_55838:518-958(-)